MKKIINLSSLLLGLVLLISAILLFGCASKPAGTSDKNLEPEKDLTFQIFNMSSHDVSVWPELVLENDPTHVLSNEDLVLSGETLAVHLNSKDLYSLKFEFSKSTAI